MHAIKAAGARKADCAPPAPARRRASCGSRPGRPTRRRGRRTPPRCRKARNCAASSCSSRLPGTWSISDRDRGRRPARSRCRRCASGSPWRPPFKKRARAVSDRRGVDARGNAARRRRTHALVRDAAFTVRASSASPVTSRPAARRSGLGTPSPPASRAARPAARRAVRPQRAVEAQHADRRVGGGEGGARERIAPRVVERPSTTTQPPRSSMSAAASSSGFCASASRAPADGADQALGGFAPARLVGE